MSTRAKKLSTTLSIVCVVLIPTLHAAFMEGQTIAAYHFHGTAPDSTLVIGPEERVVGPGIEFNDFGWSELVDIDVSDTTVVITLNSDQPAAYSDVLRLTDPTGTIPDFTDVTINAVTNYAGFDASRVRIVNGNVIDVQLSGLQGLQGQQISLTLAGGPPPQPRPVAIDIRPGWCLPLLWSAGLLPVTIRGSELVDAVQIDPASVRLDGVAPVWASIIVTPGTFCGAADSLPDLLLWFRADQIAAALTPVTYGQIRLLSLTGRLREGFGATPIQGLDFAVVLFTRY